MADPKLRFRVAPIDRNRRWFKAIFYGGPGVGKTRILGTSAEVELMQDVLFIDVEAGDATLEEFVENPHLIRVEAFNHGGLADAYKFISRHCALREREDWDKLKELNVSLGIPEEIVFRTVCLDTLTEMNSNIMYQILDIDPMKEDLALGDEPELAEFKEWNQGSEMTRLTVRGFRNLPIHVLIACGASLRTEGTSSSKSVTAPDLPGKLARAVQRFVDVVGFMQVGDKPAESGAGRETVHRTTIKPSPRIDAKCRLQGLRGVAHIDNATMSMFMDKANLAK